MSSPSTAVSGSVIMLSRVLALLVACLLLEVPALIKERPDFVRTCFMKDANNDFVNCSTHAVQRLFDELPNGVPSIDLAPLDPLFLPRVKILQGGNGPVTVNASLTNVTVTGFAKAAVVKNTVDPDQHDFHTELKLPRLRIDGNYEMFGKILVIPLQGKGTCWFDARDLDITADSDVDLVEKEGFHIFNVTGVHVRFNIGGLKLNMGNLFDGHRILEASTNAYLNANWRPVAESLNPILTKTIEDLMLDILQHVFDNIPADFFVGDL